MKRWLGFLGVIIFSIGLSFGLLQNPVWSRLDLQVADIEQATQGWQTSAHAFANINCSDCHLQAETQTLIAHPTYESCRSCHETAVETFLLGKHGIRLQEGLRPLTPAMARLPMKESAYHLSMTCNTCHDVHTVNTQEASVHSCLVCHNDPHSLNYQNSKHAELFEDDRLLPRPSSQAVSCATCHLPRQVIKQGDGSELVIVNHNNTLTLKPRDRMVSEVCMNCHGMEYSYNSIFDDELVELNFSHPPNQAMQTLEMVRVLQEKRVGEDPKK